MDIQIKGQAGEDLLPIISSIIDNTLPLVSNLSNLSRVLYEGFRHISWAGFYIADESGKTLYLGPYQGPIACTKIPFSKGVCGAAASSKTTILVDNVHEFPGHIACSSSTNSEIVVPIIKNDIVVGVIDLDSEMLSNFTQADALVLEKIAMSISQLF